ncbi:LamG-like jellyroll fold domain-containing protein [Thalassotalea sp. G2M2-11]|uniref:LamG-like jellyroll fold domain-containing protein n=1 Tax=Thalassotalea sp. G2M2-11 TaxID=2787627 RepID=UPI001F49D5D4|nr:LamG-like jellyroll fold domain-containing protein [Thalassotalea sp. G2M2-11]
MIKPRILEMMVICVFTLSACGGGGSDSTTTEQPVVPVKPSEPTDPIKYTPVEDPTVDEQALYYNDLAVHDPSIIKTNDTYYVFGSHLAAAKSTDLMQWQYMNEGDNFSNGILFSPSYAEALPEAISWTGGHVGSWASDVIQLSDNKYYFYYNHCANPASGECNMPHSYLGVAVSDNIEGPYTDKGVFLKSGTLDSVTADDLPEGIDNYIDGQMPNVIDPDVFYDKNGGLWMTYGSHFGGIWLLEMDEATAKPKPGQGYGTRLTGGGFHANEGSYVLYSPVSDYYYLFTSLAGFNANGGYNIRISRSRTPEGPYLDAAGNNMANFGGNDPTPYGVKLMGGFTFVAKQGDEGTNEGYLSPGHNSAYYDEELGKHLLITHTRFPNRGEQHSIRVHEMFITDDGWLTASPHRYAPIEGDNIVDAGDLFGHYRFIHHGNDSNTTGHQSVYLTLNNDGTITGSHTGTFTLDEVNTDRIKLMVDGIGDFDGVMKWQWDSNFKILTPTFSAVSVNNSVIWGSKLVGESSTDFLNKIADSIELPVEIIEGSLDLPTEGTLNATISWTSDNPDIISATGVVTPISSGEQTVTLTATITLDGQQLVKSYAIKVVEPQVGVLSAHYRFDDDLTEATGNFTTASVIGAKIGEQGGSVNYVQGIHGQALWLDGTSGILLPDGLINSYQYSVAFWVNPEATTVHTPVFFGALSGSEFVSFLLQNWWNEETTVWSNNNDVWFDAQVAKVPLDQWTHLAFTVDNGSVKIYVNGIEQASGSGLNDFFSVNEGTFTLGVNYWDDAPFNGLIDELRIYSSAISSVEVSELVNQ